MSERRRRLAWPDEQDLLVEALRYYCQTRVTDDRLIAMTHLLRRVERDGVILVEEDD